MGMAVHVCSSRTGEVEAEESKSSKLCKTHTPHPQKVEAGNSLQTGSQSVLLKEFQDSPSLFPGFQVLGLVVPVHL